MPIIMNVVAPEMAYLIDVALYKDNKDTIAILTQEEKSEPNFEM